LAFTSGDCASAMASGAQVTTRANEHDRTDELAYTDGHGLAQLRLRPHDYMVRFAAGNSVIA
jgi:hypothetical protein